MFAHGCRHPANALLPFHVNGTLSDTEDADVRDHVRGCAVCAAEIQALTRIAEVVRAAPLPILDGARPRRRSVGRVVLAFAAALVLGFAALAAWRLRGWSSRDDRIASVPAATAAVVADASAGTDAPGRMETAVYLDLKRGPTRGAAASPRLLAGGAQGMVVLALLLPDRPGPGDRLELIDASGRVVARSGGPVAVDAFGRVALVVPRSLVTTPGSYSVSLHRSQDAATGDAATAESPLRFPFVVEDTRER